MSVIAISIVDGFHYRYLVHSGILRKLLNQNNLLLLVQSQLIPSLKEELVAWDSNKYNIISLNEVNVSTLAKLYLFLKKNKSGMLSETINIKSESVSFLGKCLCKFIASIFPNFIVDLIGRKSFSSEYISNILKSNAVDLVVTSTPAQKMMDIPIVLEANKIGITTVSPVYSWDNLTAKGPFAFNVEHLIVWNKVLENEATFYHAYKPSNIHVTGVPIYDEYSNITFDDRNVFLRELGFKYQLPVITIATIPRVYYGDGHIKLVEILIDAVEKKELRPINILVRPHPMDDTDYSLLQNNDCVVVDNYGSKPDSSLKEWKPANNNMAHLGKTMKYSDVVLNLASTITIDAAWFDTPIINVAIDFDDAAYSGTVKRFYNYTHYKEVVTCNASVIADNKDQLLFNLNVYLDQPDKDQMERTKLINKMTMGRTFKSVKCTVDKLERLVNEG